MNWDAIAAVAQVIGLLAVVASLIYIAIQTKQTNDHAMASSETGWVTTWNQIISDWVDNQRTIQTMQKGFGSFSRLDPQEKALFSMRVAEVINQWILAQQLTQRRLLSQVIADAATDFLMATLTTDGGAEYFESGWKLFPGGKELLDRVRVSKGTQPSLTEVLPWWGANSEQ